MPDMSVLQPTIRPAEENDAPAIAAIYAPYVRDTAEGIARVRGISLAELAEAATQNGRALFGLKS